MTSEITKDDLGAMDTYQLAALKTSLYPRGIEGLAAVVLGLNGEAGEVAEHVKKTIRDDNGMLSHERRDKMLKELGDALWYISQIATHLGEELSTVAKANLDKLASRQARGVLNGSGSDR
jgi:NTP pyrophosphatase (non-canonical NTP hydrolase)